MLWNIIYDFFVMYIFGGTTSEGLTYSSSTFGFIVSWLNGEQDEAGSFTTDSFYYITLGESPDGYIYTTSLADYLCLIATIISMVAIVILCCLLIKKIYNICAHVIG